MSNMNFIWHLLLYYLCAFKVRSVPTFSEIRFYE